MLNEVVWLPLDPELRKEARYNPQKMAEWISTLEGAEYSFVKEFFAAIDHHELGWPAPFNAESVPVLLRYLEKYWYSSIKEEFLDGLRLRY